MSLFWSTLIPFAVKNAAERPMEPLGPNLMAASTGFYILSMLGLRLSLHSTLDENPALLRRRARRFAAFLVLAGADLVAAGLSWIVPRAGYPAVALVVGYVLIALHPADVERRTLAAGQGSGGQDAARSHHEGEVKALAVRVLQVTLVGLGVAATLKATEGLADFHDQAPNTAPGI